MTVKNCKALTPNEMLNVKGGLALTTTVLSTDLTVTTDLTTTTSATSDDKRRERPGGGISTY